MRSDDLGPIPVSQLKAESSSVFEALEQNRRVLISKRGVVVAVINPPTVDRVHEVAAYSLPGATRTELTSSEINNSASGVINDVLFSKKPAYVTKKDRVFGFLEPYEPAAGSLTNEQLAAIGDEVV